MKRLIGLVVVVALVLGGSSAAHGEDTVGFEVTSDFYGKYIWRGQNLSDDPVFQPGLSASYGDLTVGIWGNMDLRNINGNSGDFSEVDYSIDYSTNLASLDGVSYSVGVIYYDFPGTTVSDTTEVYWGFSFDLPLTPSVTVYHDVDEAEGSYVSLAIGHSFEKIFELGPDIPVGVEIGSSFGWASGSYNKYYWGTDSSKFQDATFSVSFPMEIAGFTVVPSVNYVTLLSDTIRDTDAYRSESDYFYAGVSLSKAF
jgi:uncharacterized protein (TIGR02001 family)